MRKSRSREPPVVFESHDPARNPRSFQFSGFLHAITARAPEEVPAVLDRIERAVAEGCHAAGFLTYEAAAGLDPVLRVKQPGDLPLVWFGIFRARAEIAPGSFGTDAPFSLSAWVPSLDRTEYLKQIERIREYIAQGDTYQVNFTFRQRAAFSGNAVGLFRALCRSQRAGFCAYLDLGRHVVISASPEMFFSLKGNELTVRPMKGTAPRGRWWEEDDSLARALQQSPKNRAENVMIVDLMRNDLGRVAEVGSVCVPSLYEVERYETVFQMTSTVRCRVRAGVSLCNLFAALFPSGSVTGAPKIRTMQIIGELEDGPRGIYTGAIGFFSPGPDALFNVAIRTVLVDRAANRAEFGVGGGITFDSDAAAEYEECLLKSRFLNCSRRREEADRPCGRRRKEAEVEQVGNLPFVGLLTSAATGAATDFNLFETLLYEPSEGFFLLERHLERLEHSARYFRFCFDCAEAVRALRSTAAILPEGRFRVRLSLARNGRLALTHTPAPAPPAFPPKVALAAEPVDSSNPFLYHKTTRREIYSRARARPDCADVILVNERGELTESTVANLVVALDGRLYSPPLHCGLLPGTFRAELLAHGEITERVLFPDDLARAESIHLINALRKWTRIELVP